MNRMCLILEKAKKYSTKKGSFAYRVYKLLENKAFIDILSSQELTHLLNEEAGKKIKLSNLSSQMETLLKEVMSRFWV